MWISASGDGSLPKYTQEREEVLQVAEENAVLEKDQSENHIPDEKDIIPHQDGSEANTFRSLNTGFQGRIRKWFKSVLSLFKHS